MRECTHERSHIGDSRFFGHLYSTEVSQRIFCDTCRVQRWLDIEAALALSQAELDLIPLAHAQRIARVARVELLDLERVRTEIRETRHSLVAILRALQAAAGPEAGEFVHYGATTQDIQDTGQALEMRDVLNEVDAEIHVVLRVLADVARKHAATLMVGRTHARAALPTTFGMKVAGWLDELLRHTERIDSMKSRVLVAQLFGGVGTMASFGTAGPALLGRFSLRLGLAVPTLGWHVARDRVADYVATMAMIASTLARIIDEVRTLSRPEFAELEEVWQHGSVGSSTMPHKRNPEACQQVVVLARLAASQVPLALQAMVVEHERDSRALRLEWPAVADVSHCVLAAFGLASRILNGLVVREDVMARNAGDVADAVCSEALMLALAEHLGKQSAHAHVYEICQAAKTAGRPMSSDFENDPVVREHLSAAELADILDPRQQLGPCSQLVEGILEQVQARLANRTANAPDAPVGDTKREGDTT